LIPLLSWSNDRLLGTIANASAQVECRVVTRNAATASCVLATAAPPKPKPDSRLNCARGRRRRNSSRLRVGGSCAVHWVRPSRARARAWGYDPLASSIPLPDCLSSTRCATVPKSIKRPRWLAGTCRG